MNTTSGHEAPQVSACVFVPHPLAPDDRTTIIDGERIPGRRLPWRGGGPGRIRKGGLWWWADSLPGRPDWTDHEFIWKADDGRRFYISECYGLTNSGLLQLADIARAGWRVGIDYMSGHGHATLRIVIESSEQAKASRAQHRKEAAQR